MHLARYKSVLALPGMRTFMLVSLIARIPGTAWTTALTLSVVLDRHRSYAEAGAATAAFTVGLALGSPLLGRAIDRGGPRPVLLLTGLVSLLFWNLVPILPYSAVLALAVPCGALQVPVTTLVRQSLAARVPEQVRRQAYSLDSMAVELSFMVGPALAVLAITQLGEATSTLRVLGVGLGLSAAVLYAYNPRLHDGASSVGKAGAEGAEHAAARPKAKAAWLAPGFLMILAVCAAACMMLASTDVAIVAVLRGHGQIEWAGIVVITWCAASMVGGFVHGAMPRPLPMTVLLLALGALSIPIGLAGSWWLLCLVVIPAGLACAPTIASTVDGVSRAVPAERRGQAMGMHSAALTVGGAIGSPLVGIVIDSGGTGWGMAVMGAMVCVLALVGITAQFLRRQQVAAARVFEDYSPARAAYETGS
ncbi:MFS transporter [Actinospica sp. MGRD01-02]|uniref:MFS transporter n=1 Tax=Actinospica acidithermotolerans TaxID=2828514 RepID=A0A941E6B3_9ACTN|nr:MFS transporter [Actinospica acidithermotolerans]MBR7827150.1 MFS transporter [Actinospica acidithermotolerans]